MVWHEVSAFPWANEALISKVAPQFTAKLNGPAGPRRPVCSKRRPDLYAQYKGGLDGGDPHNPMGAAALYMEVNGRPTYYRIHDTNIQWPIGLAYEIGCIKLRNDHMQMLYQHVKVGTRIIVT